MAKAEAVELDSVGLLDSGFLWKVFYVFAALAALSVAISMAGRVLGKSIAMAGHSDDVSLAEIVVGNNVLGVPRNLIRFEAARRDGVTAKLDLYMRWPALDGYSDNARDDFNHTGQPSIIFATVTEAMMSRDMSGRFAPIYSHLSMDTGTTAAGGLSVRAFTAQSGYANEILLIAPSGGPKPYVVRCLDGASAAQSLAPCERDVQIGDGLSLTYRFPRELLGDWKQIDETVVARVGAMLKTAE